MASPVEGGVAVPQARRPARRLDETPGLPVRVHRVREAAAAPEGPLLAERLGPLLAERPPVRRAEEGAAAMAPDAVATAAATRVALAADGVQSHETLATRARTFTRTSGKSGQL